MSYLHTTTSSESYFRNLLRSSGNTKELKQKILSIINRLGRYEFSLSRLDPIKSFDNLPGLIPRLILSSFPVSNKPDNVLYKAQFSNIHARHIALLYHYIASSPAHNTLRHRPYILITSAPEGGYSVHSNHPDYSEYYYHCQTSDSLSPRIGSKTTTALQQLVNAISHIGVRRFDKLFLAGTGAKQVAINEQPLKLINTLARQDLTLNQAANQLNLTIHTINKHMATAKLQLGTQTIAGTIWKAMSEGLIAD